MRRSGAVGRKIDSSFYDDSSSAMGLSHSADYAEEVGSCEDCGRPSPRFRCTECQARVDERYERVIEPLRAEELQRLKKSGVRIIELPDGEQIADTRNIVATNAGAHDDVEARARAIARSEGISLAEAVSIAVGEIPPSEAPEPKPKDSYLGASIESIGFDRKGNGKGGSRSGRKKGGKKKGTWVCDICRLEYCEHRPKAGRPRKEPTVRDVKRRVRMTAETHALIAKMGVGIDDALMCLGVAYREDRLIDDVLKEWQRLHPPAKMKEAG